MVLCFQGLISGTVQGASFNSAVKQQSTADLVESSPVEQPGKALNIIDSHKPTQQETKLQELGDVFKCVKGILPRCAGVTSPIEVGGNARRSIAAHQ